VLSHGVDVRCAKTMCALPMNASFPSDPLLLSMIHVISTVNQQAGCPLTAVTAAHRKTHIDIADTEKPVK